jgi:aspartyl-tRNA(Asn)/glutamyl-tRNA(Gln) amidotransferase subunit C
MMRPRSEVVELAQLARVAVPAATVDRLCVELGHILDHVAMLGEVDTTGVLPMTHAVAMSLRLRPDEIAPPLPVEVATRGAAIVRDDGFEVPAVIRED